MHQILIAENEKRIYRPLVKELQSIGLKLSVTHIGAEARSQALQSNFDLAIIDSNLPDQSGWQVLQYIHQTQADILSIMLVNPVEMCPTNHSLYAQASDIIFKPFSLKELLIRVQRCLQKTDSLIPLDTPILKQGDITLELTSRKVWKGNKCVDLSAQEFTLMNVLMSEPGKVFDRKYLLQKAWGYEHDSRSNVVDVYIAYLRKKLGPQSIKTVRGKGYQLLPQRP